MSYVGLCSLLSTANMESCFGTAAHFRHQEFIPEANLFSECKFLA